MSDPVTSISVAGVPIEPSSWKLDITNDIPSVWDTKRTVEFVDSRVATFEATFDVQTDRATLEALLAVAPVFTVEIETDHNPWHVRAISWRARLRRIRDGVSWTFQRRVLRRELIERTKIVVPACRWGSLDV